MWRKIRYGMEAVLLIIFWLIFRAMPLDFASWLGGCLGRAVGPFTRAHKTAEYNLTRVMPQYTAQEREKILHDMWDNLGRVMGEYPHLTRPIMRERITIDGVQYLDQIKGEAALYLSGHFANWEIAPMSAAYRNITLVLIYRAPNNPISDWFIRQTRNRYCKEIYNKGREGAAKLIKAFKQKKSVGLLLDQKMNDGEALNFFGFPAMTATAGITLALRANAAIVVARVERVKGAHFHVTVTPPKQYAADTTTTHVMDEIHTLFETWIRQRPAQWFWVHNRWNWREIDGQP